MSQIKKANEALKTAVEELKAYKSELDGQETVATSEQIEKLQKMSETVTSAKGTVDALKSVPEIEVGETVEYSEEVSSNVSQSLNLGVSGAKKIESLGVEKYKEFHESILTLNGKNTFSCNYLGSKEYFKLQAEGYSPKEASDFIIEHLTLADAINLATTISTNVPGQLPTRFDSTLYRIMADREGFYRRSDVRSVPNEAGNTVQLPKMTDYGTTPESTTTKPGETGESQEIEPVYGTTPVTVARRAVHKDLSDTVVRGTTVDMVDATMQNLVHSLMDDIEQHIFNTAVAPASALGTKTAVGNSGAVALSDLSGVITALDTGYFRDSQDLPIWLGNHSFYVNRYALNTGISRVLNLNQITSLAGDLFMLGFRYVLAPQFSNAANAANNLAFFGLPRAAIVVGETGMMEFSQDVANIKTSVLTINLQTYLGSAVQDAAAGQVLVGKA